jgi:hypothetical protein
MYWLLVLVFFIATPPVYVYYTEEETARPPLVIGKADGEKETVETKLLL